MFLGADPSCLIRLMPHLGRDANVEGMADFQEFTGSIWLVHSLITHWYTLRYPHSSSPISWWPGSLARNGGTIVAASIVSAIECGHSLQRRHLIVSKPVVSVSGNDDGARGHSTSGGGSRSPHDPSDIIVHEMIGASRNASACASLESVMSILRRNNVTVMGNGDTPMLFAHGYGCDQHMWRLITPAFTDSHRLILFDHVGAGRSDLSAYDRDKYRSLQGYVDDMLEICNALDVRHGVFVGHSVSAMIGALAAIQEPNRFDHLVLVGPSPRYIDDDDYIGGFSEHDIRELLEFQDRNFLGWSASLAPVIMSNNDRPELAEELRNSFCRTDPEIAKQFAAVTFLSDNRADLLQVPVRSLVLQCREDTIAPMPVGAYVQRQLPNAEMVVLNATGHCPHLSAPEETIAAIQAFLGTS
jgi:sigma-B regulation protein RsbQ